MYWLVMWLRRQRKQQWLANTSKVQHLKAVNIIALCLGWTWGIRGGIKKKIKIKIMQRQEFAALFWERASWRKCGTAISRVSNQSGRNSSSKEWAIWEDGNPKMFVFKSLFDTEDSALISVDGAANDSKVTGTGGAGTSAGLSLLLLYNHGIVKITGERPSKHSGRPSRLQFKMTKLLFLFLL